MTRKLLAASLAVLMLAAPAIALAADPAPATTDAPMKKAKDDAPQSQEVQKGRTGLVSSTGEHSLLRKAGMHFVPAFFLPGSR